MNRQDSPVRQVRSRPRPSAQAPGRSDPQVPVYASEPRVQAVQAAPAVAPRVPISSAQVQALPSRARVAPRRAPSSEELAADLMTPAAPRVRQFDVVPTADKAYVAVEIVEMDEVQPLKTAFFDSIKQVNALTVPNQRLSTRPRSENLAKSRGYDRDDLMAIAEVAYHYLMSGGTMLALTLFEGLNAVAPEDPYFALALGLTHDHLGEKQVAYRWYNRAAELDPGDARADVNRAELLLEERKVSQAKELLARAVQKAQGRGEEALAKKAAAILAHISRAA